MIRAAALATVAAALPGLPAAAQDRPPGVAATLDAARESCAELGGELTVGHGATAPLDFSAAEVWIVDHGALDCPAAPSLFCGTGGCLLSLLAGGGTTERYAKGWRMVDMAPHRVMLLQVHGSLCGGINPTPCFEALALDPDSGTLTSLAPRPQ